MSLLTLFIASMLLGAGTALTIIPCLLFYNMFFRRNRGGSLAFISLIGVMMTIGLTAVFFGIGIYF